MNKLISILLIALLLTTVHSSCTKKLDLDEDTSLLIEKQDKLARLNELFDLSFENPQQAKAEYELFVAAELFTTDRNFLTDSDVRMSSQYTSAVIQLNLGFEQTATGLADMNLFELYDTKFRTYINNRDILGDVPLQLKKGERYERFKEKVADINTYFNDRIKEKIEKSSTDKNITGKKWLLSTFFYDWDRGALHNIHFDFILNEDKSSTFNAFFFIPFARYSDVDEKLMTDLQSNLLAAPEYAIYNNKICFYFQLKDNIDYVRNTGHMERSWVFEFTYQVDGNNLLLSEPRKRRYLAPFYYNDNYDDEGFSSFYPNELQQFTLQTAP